MIENLGVFATVRRSVQLTRGTARNQIFHRLPAGCDHRICGIYRLSGTIHDWQLLIDRCSEITSLPTAWLALLAASISGAVGGTVTGSISDDRNLVLCYYDTRIRKEAFDLQFMMASLDRPSPAAGTVRFGVRRLHTLGNPGPGSLEPGRRAASSCYCQFLPSFVATKGAYCQSTSSSITVQQMLTLQEYILRGWTAVCRLVLNASPGQCGCALHELRPTRCPASWTVTAGKTCRYSVGTEVASPVRFRGNREEPGVQAARNLDADSAETWRPTANRRRPCKLRWHRKTLPNRARG